MPEEELYDLEADALERTNLAGDPEHAGIRQELAGRLDDWLAKVNAPGKEMSLPEGSLKEAVERIARLTRHDDLARAAVPHSWTGRNSDLNGSAREFSVIREANVSLASALQWHTCFVYPRVSLSPYP